MLLDSKVADKVISTVIQKMDIENVDVDILKEVVINKDIVEGALEEYGLSDVINLDSL